MSALHLIRWHETELTGLLARIDGKTAPELHARMTARLAEATREREYLAKPVAVNPFLVGAQR